MVFGDTTVPQRQISYYSVRAGNDAGLSAYSRANPGFSRSSVPLVGLGLNKNTFGPGDTLRLEVALANAGPAAKVDMYLGALVPTSLGPALGCPARDGVVFFADGATKVVVSCLSSAPQSFAPLLQDLLIAQPFKVFPNLLAFQWPSGPPAGAYVFFVALTRPSASSNGTANPNDVIAVAIDSTSFTG
jgi:hypothetical protein